MKYMSKKGEDFPIPFDEVVYDATIYDVFEILEGASASVASESDKPKKGKSTKAAPSDYTIGADTFKDVDFDID